MESLARFLQEIYATCQFVSPAISQCSLKDSKFFDPKRKKKKKEGQGGDKIVLCADETWCITSETQLRIRENIAAFSNVLACLSQKEEPIKSFSFIIL